MVTVILPGFSIKNKNWAVETAEKVNLNHEVRPVFWSHWDNPEDKFDAKEKADDVTDILLNDSANIIAKSIGTLVASHMIGQIPSRIQKVIFCGIPLNDIDEGEKETVRSALRVHLPENIICFQNEEDPHGSFDQIKAFVGDINSKIKVVKQPRQDHEYPYFEEFQSFFKG